MKNSEEQNKLLSKMMEASNYIHKASKNGYGNFVIVGNQDIKHHRQVKIEKLLGI